MIPLIGGMTIAARQFFGYDPEWIASWSSIFNNNDKFCLDYFPQVPYYDLDDPDAISKLKGIDILLCLPPCAGLSGANTTVKGTNPRGCDAPSNQHMLTTSEIGMRDLDVKLIMVENAPALFTSSGEKFANNICKLANKYGYSMNLVKTNSIYHGIPQSRDRSFFFLWKGNKVPVFHKLRKPYQSFAELMVENPIKIKSPFVNRRDAYRPSQDPLVEFIIKRGREKGLFNTYSQMIQYYASEAMTSAWDIIYRNDLLDEAIDYTGTFRNSDGDVLGQRGHKWLLHCKDKKSRGLNVLNCSVKLGWEKINALTWQIMPYLAHPHKDRWLTIAEALTLMKFPQDFIATNKITTQESNVICQNVPVCTAQDWLGECVAALEGEREWLELQPGQISRQNNAAHSKAMEVDLS